MGVPKFYAWLLKTFTRNKIVLNNIDTKNFSLYLDANCLFHPQCYYVLDNVPSPNEEKMFNRILEYITIILDYVNVEDVYLAVDGVAPMAKICQQRKRRFKAVVDEEIKNNIKKKYNEKTREWSNINITPGTDFMETLHQKLLYYIKNSKYKIKYSSYHEKGEGEHKIIQHIKTSTNSNVIIYGLDADLIFLSLTMKNKNIYLLREEKEQYTTKEILTYISIDGIKNLLYNHIQSKININKEKFINDFILLCYLLGNDFLPNLPTLSMKYIDELVNIYCYTYTNTDMYMVNEGELNNTFFIFLLKMLANSELNYYKDLGYDIERRRRKEFRGGEQIGSNKEMWEFENLKNFHMENPYNYLTMDLKIIKYNYYSGYFKTNSNSLKKMLIENYLEGFKWVSLYYFDKCPNEYWQYKYTHAPFISDIYEYIVNNNYEMNIKFINNNTNISPLKQLMMVIPLKYKYLLPLKYQQLMDSKLISYYPIAFNVDYLNKEMLHQCIPMIPYIELSDFNVVDNIKLSEKENEKNKIDGTLFKN